MKQQIQIAQDKTCNDNYYIQGESLARGPKLLSMYQSNSAGFLFINTGKQVQMADGILNGIW